MRLFYLVSNFKYQFPQHKVHCWACYIIICTRLPQLFVSLNFAPKTSHWNQFWFQAIPKYLENCRFLPKLNNEKPGERNSTYKERFSSLENLVLIMVSPLTISFFHILGTLHADYMWKKLFICRFMLCCNSLSRIQF